MSLTPEQSAKFRAESFEAGCALVDDLTYLREVVAKADPSAAELRRISVLLRRILVERDLAKVAAPRMGKVALTVHDLHRLYKRVEEKPNPIFATGTNIVAFTAQIAGLIVHRTDWSGMQVGAGFDPDAVAECRLDNFLAQRIMYVTGEWVSRNDIIKYVANFGHGVHSLQPRENADKLIRKARACASISALENGFRLNFDFERLSITDPPLKFDKGHIDCALMEILSTARLLTTTRDVHELETLMHREITDAKK
ncbi:hypothetical protein RFM68_25580 [Mesorhizobium sp. MSK_1335]|uniref:Uncharacterized protein n=1 Tax=Mesorhizobium montanum TaxID=3072323 RepID=A0ABU4ZS55_9HYPH|nr:hypothetical protein [Mesorhizobium sp. MSK_1335]MDX8527872.1 hypothetical protein [Mesorhizobium sp. MSK_1335]